MNPFPIIYIMYTRMGCIFFKKLISHRSHDIFCLQCFQVLWLSWWSLTRWCSADHGASDPCCRNQSSEANLFSRYGFGWVTQFLHHQGRYMPREVANENDWPFPATWSYQPNNETVPRLHAISSCMARIYALRMSNVDRLAFLVPIEIVELVKKKSYIAWSIDRLWFPLRLATKATTLIQDLGKLSDEICEVNSAGLAEGHTPEQLSLLHMNWNSQCVALKKWYISYINHDWCAHGAICSKILSI